MNRKARPVGQRTTRQEIEITFSRMLDAVEENDEGEMARTFEELSRLGLHIGFRMDCRFIVRAERAQFENC